MGQTDKGPGAGGHVPDGHEPSRTSTWGDDDDLFDSSPSVQLRWHAEARLLLNEVLEKVPPQERGPAQRQAERQVEALARQQGVTEISAELAGLALGGMSSVVADDES